MKGMGSCFFLFLILSFVCMMVDGVSSEAANAVAEEKSSHHQDWLDHKEKRDREEYIFYYEWEKVQREMTALENGSPLYVMGMDALHAHFYDKAIELFKEAIVLDDHVPSMYELGRLYEYGEGVTVDVEISARYYKDAAIRGYPKAQRAYAFMLDLGRGVEKNHPMALLYYTFAAKGFDQEALLILGAKHLHGYGVPKSCSIAAQYYQSASRQVVDSLRKAPYLPSYYSAVYLKDILEGKMPQDKEELIAYAKFHADPDDATSLLEMGSLYFHGLYGHEVDYNIAKSYFEAAGDHGQAFAMLGQLYQYGLGVDKDVEEAKQLFMLATEKKNFQGMIFLGEILLQEKQYNTALDLFQTAAQSRVAEAFLYLGYMHMEGVGVPQNFETALSFISTATTTSRTKAGAESDLYQADMHYYGIGTPRNCLSALKKYQHAIDKGPLLARLEHAFQAYEEGNEEKAFLIYEKLSSCGLRLAQLNAAFLAESTFRLTADTKSLSLALTYYEKAADTGSDAATLILGDFFYYGMGDGFIPRDWPKAVSYYRQLLFNPRAYFNLGYMHQFGEGVPKDLHLAKRNYDLAMEFEPSSFLAVYLCLAELGIEYSYELLSQGEIERWSEDLWYYFFPEVYYFFFDQAMKDLEIWQNGEENPEEGGVKTPAQLPFLDRESVFGYQWDTVLIYTIASALLIGLLFRFGIIQVQIE